MLQAGWAQLLMWLTGQHDVAFGTAVSGRPAERCRRRLDGGPVDQHRAGAGQLHRRHHDRRLTRPTAPRQQPHPRAPAPGANRNPPRHGHDQLFDTLFVYENYPIDTANLAGADGLAISEMTAREYNHYPLTLQAMPGD